MLTAVGIEELHRRYFDDVKRYVQRRVRDPDLAEDIAQETFLRAFRSRDTYDASRSPWPWLMTIARNLMINAVRDGNRRPATNELTDDAADPHLDADPEWSFTNHERYGAIVSSMSSLSPRQRRVLMLRCVDELSYEEIARTEGLTPDALKSLLKRARQRFRIAYAEISGEAGVPVVVVGLKRRWTSAKVRAAEASPLAEVAVGDVAQMCVIATMAAVISFSSTPAPDDVPPQRGVDRIVAVAPSSPQATSAAPEGPAERRQFIEGDTRGATADQPVEVTVAGSVDDDRADRRAVKIDRRDERPGREGDEGSETGVEVPCLPVPYDPICGAVSYGMGK